MESVKAKHDDDVFHFIGYMPKGDKVYELDGLKPGPICLGPVTPGGGALIDPKAKSDLDWLQTVRPEIQRRMAKFTEGEIHFNLMAMTRDRTVVAQEEIAAVEKQLAEAAPAGSDGPVAAAAELQAVAQSRLVELRETLKSEAALKARWQIENKRRQHNYLPFIVALLKKLAAANKLQPMREAGAKYVADTIKQKQQQAEKAKASGTTTGTK